MDQQFHISFNNSLRQLTSLPCQDPCGGDAPLHVIVCINNYVRFKRRYELFWKFQADIEKLSNVILYVVEVAFGHRPFMVTQGDNPRHLQLRTNNELWHKENSINLMVQRLPADWKYMAWIDADVQFINTNFATETIHQLQHYKIVQLFQNVINLGPQGEVLSVYKGFVYQYLQGKPYTTSKYTFWHPGFAWACTREGWNDAGGLIDFAILGAADHHMALAWVGMAEKSLPQNISSAYRKLVMSYQERCEKHIRRNVGFVPGTIVHSWHGAFKNRKYIERWDVLTKNNFDPECDIKRDWQGLFILNSDEKINLRDGIRAYFRSRCEDSIDTE